KKIEYRFCGPCHLMIAYEQGSRSSGQTVIEGLSPSSLCDLQRKLTFVPAGRDFYECQEPRSSSRFVYLYFEPSQMPVGSDAGFSKFAPRLRFEDPVLWEAIQKLSALAKNSDGDNPLYMEALETVVSHELVRLNSKTAQIRVGLACRQRRIVTAYIEEHLAD